MKKYGGEEAIAARVSQIVEARKNPAPKPKDPKTIVLPIINPNMQLDVEQIIAKKLQEAKTDTKNDAFSQSALELLSEEIAYAKRHKLNFLLKEQNILRAYHFAIGNVAEATPLIDNEQDKLQRLFKEASKKDLTAEQIVTNCGILVCANGGTSRGVAQQYIQDRIRLNMGTPGQELTNKIYRDQLSSLGAIHQKIINNAMTK